MNINFVPIQTRIHFRIKAFFVVYTDINGLYKMYLNISKQYLNISK